MARTVSSLIARRAREDAPGGTQDIPNPARLDEIVATVRLADATTFVEACAAARSAQREWARVPAPVRGRAIQQLGRLVEDNAEIARPDHDPRDRQAAGRGPRLRAGGRGHLQLLRLGGPTALRDDGPVRAPGQAAVHVPQPGRRRGDRHGGELPGRGPVLVPRPVAPVRERGGLEAGRVRARHLGGARPAVPTRRLPRWRVQHGARRRGRDVRRGSRRPSTRA